MLIVNRFDRENTKASIAIRPSHIGHPASNFDEARIITDPTTKPTTGRIPDAFIRKASVFDGDLSPTHSSEGLSILDHTFFRHIHIGVGGYDVLLIHKVHTRLCQVRYE